VPCRYTWALVLLRADGTDEDGSVAAVLYTNRATCAAQLVRFCASSCSVRRRRWRNLTRGEL
jgi:hypothetical protein